MKYDIIPHTGKESVPTSNGTEDSQIHTTEGTRHKISQIFFLKLMLAKDQTYARESSQETNNQNKHKKKGPRARNLRTEKTARTKQS